MYFHVDCYNDFCLVIFSVSGGFKQDKFTTISLTCEKKNARIVESINWAKHMLIKVVTLISFLFEKKMNDRINGK